MKTVILVGQPNSGKSSLFNALAGYRAVTSNYPGTTVEALEAKVTLCGERIRLVDTPGIYSLSDATLEERVTKKILLESQPDVVINLLDAISLEKGLYFTLQLLEAGLPVIVAFGMIAKELGWRWALTLTLTALISGLLISGLVLRIILLVGGLR